MSDTKSATHSTHLSYEISSREWLREVPEHWETTTIRRYCRVFSGATPDRANPKYWNGGTIPWIASGDVNLRRIVKAQQFISEAGYKASSTKYINPGSLVLALAGQGRTKGMVATVECRTTCNQSLAAIEPSHQLSNYNFLAYFLESRYADIRALVGNGLRDGLNLEHIRGIQTPLPPLDEQAAIVRYLDHADQKIQAYIGAKQKLIALLEEQRQGVIHQAVTRGLDPNVKLKPSSVEWLGDVPEHWDTVKIQDLASQIPKSFTDGDWIESPYITTDGIRLIQTGNIGVGRYLEKGYRYISERTFEELHCTEVTPNDILICRLGEPVARACAAPDLARRMITSVDVCIVKVREDLNTKFAIYSMASRQYLDWVGSLVRGSTRDRISRFMLSKFGMPFPPKNEQNQIVDNLDKVTAAIDATIDLAHRQTRLMEEYRTRLIADVVTGKLDVRKAAEEQPAVEPSQTAN